MAKSDEQIINKFDEAVNMSRKELEEWLQTDESKSVGQGDGESKGHESGRKIVEILGKKKSDYTEDDVDHMRRVVSYVHRHRVQRPEGALLLAGGVALAAFPGQNGKIAFMRG